MDQHLNSDDKPALSPEEAEEPDGVDATEWRSHTDQVIAEVLREMAEAGLHGPQLISRDQLLAAGALYVPPAWRKSLSGEEEPDLLSGLSDDDDQPSEEQGSDGRKGDRETKGTL